MIRGVITAAVLAGCVHVADDRARRDATVGRREIEGASILVDDGLAAVRTFALGEVVLWAQAPGLVARLEVAPGGPREWIVTFRNALADAALEARAGDGTALALISEPTPVVTERRWRVTVGADGTAVLTLSSPDGGDPGRWRFAALADVQDAIDDVGDIYGLMAADPTLRFVVFSGDLVEAGTVPELERFERELARLPIPVYATLGNHELLGPREDLFHDFFGRGNTHFSFRGVHFTLLDSASGTISPIAYEWLDEWLEEGRDGLHLVFMHIPPLDPAGTRNGAFASRAEAHALVSTLARAGVDLTVYGHIHSYVPFSNAGIPAFISGGGGAIPERFDGIGRHYLAIDVDPTAGRVETALARVD